MPNRQSNQSASPNSSISLDNRAKYNDSSAHKTTREEAARQEQVEVVVEPRPRARSNKTSPAESVVFASPNKQHTQPTCLTDNDEQSPAGKASELVDGNDLKQCAGQAQCEPSRLEVGQPSEENELPPSRKAAGNDEIVKQRPPLQPKPAVNSFVQQPQRQPNNNDQLEQIHSDGRPSNWKQQQRQQQQQRQVANDRRPSINIVGDRKQSDDDDEGKRPQLQPQPQQPANGKPNGYASVKSLISRFSSA